MAGIGFELKKLFRRKGLLAGLRAYGCAGILCTGPMLLGVLLQLGILVLCSWAGAAKTEQDLLVCMVTDTLLASLTVTSLFAMPVTRFLADMLYEEQEQLVLPSFWGCERSVAGGRMWAVRAVSAGVRCDAFAGAALPGPLCGDDRELERRAF